MFFINASLKIAIDRCTLRFFSFFLFLNIQVTKDTDLHALLDFLVDSLGHPHEQNLWQSVDEDAPDPRRHFVRGRFAVVHVEDDDGDEDGQADEEHGE